MRFLLALLVSVGVHALLAVGLAVCLMSASEPDVLATLDLSSVELSFAETIDESAAALPPAPPAQSEVRPKPDRAPVPEIEKPMPIPPDPSPLKLPEPQEVQPPLQELVERKTRQESAPPEELKQSNNPNNQTLSPSPAPRQARIDAPPRPRRTIRPDYPKGARRRGEQGEVTLEIQVDAEGAVSEARVIVSSGFADLDEAAVRAVQKAQFTPARSGSATVASLARVKLDFRLR